MTHASEPTAMHDSGNRQSFATGAVRDTADDKPRPDLYSPFAEERVGEWLRLGAVKYSERNWEKGIPNSRCFASLRRHAMRYHQGDQSEDHLAAIIFNAMAIIHNEEMIRRSVLPAELDDMPMYQTACENATRLALVYACSRDHETPSIDREAAEWASRFVRHLAERMLFMASSHVADNPFHAECLKVKRRLRDAPNQCLQRQKLLKALRCKAADFDQIISTLIQQGEVVLVDMPTKTKTAQGYRLA